MQYNKKFKILCSVCGALFVIYILTFVFDTSRTDAKKAKWTIIPAKKAENVASIEISGDENIKLIKSEGLWAVADGDSLFPAKQQKIREFLDDLSKPEAYPVRSTKGEDLESFGLTGDAKRIVLKDVNDTILDIKVGNTDSTGKNIYINRAGDKEVRAGKDIFTQYLSSRLNSWEDLRLFPSDDAVKTGANGKNLSVSGSKTEKPLTHDDVQRLIVYQKAETEAQTPKTDFTLVRADKGWKFEESGDAADTTKVTDYIQTILDSTADGFSSELDVNDAVFAVSGKVPGRIILELGTGASYSITLGPKADEKQTVAVSGSKFVHTLAQWTINRLWVEGDSLK